MLSIRFQRTFDATTNLILLSAIHFSISAALITVRVIDRANAPVARAAVSLVKSLIQAEI